MSSSFILALVGRSGVGKTTLLMELLKRLPDTVFPIRVLTTRERRGPEDDVFCRFTDAETICELRDQDALAHYLEYAGNVYGCAKADVDWALARGIGVQAFVEDGIRSLRQNGYRVVPMKVVADQEVERDALRTHADQEREKAEVRFSHVLQNSFAPGGLARAADELEQFVAGQHPQDVRRVT